MLLLKVKRCPFTRRSLLMRRFQKTAIIIVHIYAILLKITDPELDSTAAASSSLLFLRTDAYPSVTNLKQTCPTSIFAFIAE